MKAADFIKKLWGFFKYRIHFHVLQIKKQN